MKKYDVIYADPPWSYYNDSDALPECTTIRGMRRPPYPVMGSESIKSLPIQDLSKDNCILFIWTTDYHLQKCIEIIQAWGFTYKTIGFVWAKLNKDKSHVTFMGAYTMKSGCELCLIATRGKDATKLVKQHNIRGYYESIRERHSKKPDEIRSRIDSLVGEVDKIELFARQFSDGWDVWGNEVESDIELGGVNGQTQRQFE